ncbi:MAG: peptidyl-prolyl cis-trans isomerase [Burkholderiales bacterium]|nr:peptidyl-prolyl cis-trans isomerase [Burkholderiales bacterium]
MSKRSSRVARGALVALLLGIAGAAGAVDKLPAGVVAKMGDVEMKTDELKQLLDALPPEARAQLAANPGELAKVVRTEMIRRSLAVEARGKAWDKRPEVMAQMDRARDAALVAAYMNSVARPPESYPSEAELKAAYEQNSASFSVPKQYRISQLFVLAPADTDKAAFAKALAKATDLAERAKKKGADFAALAKASSEHADSAAKGGDMGFVAESNLIPELREPIAALKKGDIVGPIKAPSGWHVVRLDDVREKGTKPLAEVRDQLWTFLRARKAQETEQAYLTFMTNKNPVSINDAELPRLPAPAAPK